MSKNTCNSNGNGNGRKAVGSCPSQGPGVGIKALLAGAALSAVCAAGNAQAQGFQAEAGIAIGKGEVSNIDLDTMAVRGKYFLRAVSPGSGPFAEAPFLAKASHAALTHIKIDPERGNKFDSLELSGHFVTQTDRIYDLDFEREDAGGQSGTSNNVALGVGRYLDDRTTGTLRLELDDDAADTKRLGASLRHLSDGATPGTWYSYDAGAALIDASDTGFKLNAEGRYYLSQQLGVSAGFEYTKIKNGDETAFSVGASYFLSESLYTSVEYSRSSGDVPDSNNLLLGVAMRF